MRGIHARAGLGAVLLCATAPAMGWSLLDEVTVLDPSVSVQMDFELPFAKNYCESLPENLDRLECEILQVEDFWFGVDAAGNRYGVISTADPNGTYFDVLRRPPGSQLSEPVLRITKRTEFVFGEPTKIQVSGHWTVDPSGGEMTLTFRGQCLTAACAAQSDVGEHMGTMRVSGLPGLFEIAASYVPPSTVSFVVPAVPEGLPTGSRMDVYAGSLASLPDFSQAQAVQCDVASGLPPGAVLSIGDSLGDPPPGEGRYYVAAVVSGGDRRIGRRTESGQLTARDPAGLPACPGS